MRTHRRKPSLHKRVRQGTKRAIRRYQFGGGGEEDYQHGLAMVKEGNFTEAVILFQKAIDQDHPSAALWLQYAMKKIAQSVKVENIRKLNSNSNTFYLDYLINQGNSIRATHKLFYNKIIEKAKPYVYPSRLQRTKNMLGSLAFWGGGGEQELYDSTLSFDPVKVKQMAEFVIDAGQHSLVSSNQDMLLLISNIAKWIERGTTDINLAKRIVTASKNLTEIHLLTEIQSKRQEGQDTKSARINAEAELTSYFMQMESNVVKALQKWDEMDSYSKLVKNIMGEAAAGGRIVEKVIKGIKTKRFVGGDVRAEILASIPNTAQCNTGMIDSKKDKCYLCGLKLDDYEPEYLWRKAPEKAKAKAKTKEDCATKGQTLCPPNAIDCEHVLGIQLALSHLNLVHTGDREYQKTTSKVYKEVINSEYDWSHKCCNMMKLDRSFIRKIVEGEDTGFYEPDNVAIASVLNSISAQYKLNKNDLDGYAYGCGCIGLKISEYAEAKTAHMLNLAKSQLENVVARVRKVTDMINLQIAGIKKHLQSEYDGSGFGGTSREKEQYRRASEVYDSFIKFRFLSRITKNNWIKALVNNFKNGSITPGSTEEIEENGQMEGGVQFGGDDIENFVQLVNEQSSYDMASIQIMSDNTVVDGIKNIIKDICYMGENYKKEKLIEIKTDISRRIHHGDVMIQTDINELTSDSTQNILSTFLNGTVPNVLDYPIPVKQDRSKEYAIYCKARRTAAEFSAFEESQMRVEAKRREEERPCPEKLYSKYSNYELKMFSGALSYYNPHIHMREEEAKDICRRMEEQGTPEALQEWLEKQWEEERKKMNSPDMQERLGRAVAVIAEHEANKQAQREAARFYGVSRESPDFEADMAKARKERINKSMQNQAERKAAAAAAYEAAQKEEDKRRQIRIQQQEQTKYHSPFNKMAGLKLPTTDPTVHPQKLPTPPNSLFVKPPTEPSLFERAKGLFSSSSAQPPQALASPQQAIASPPQALPYTPPPETKWSRAPSQPTSYEQQEEKRKAAAQAEIQHSIALGKAQRSASNQSWKKQQDANMQELQQQQQIREKMREPPINTVRKYTNAYDPRSNAFGSTFRSLILPSATPHNPVPPSISSEVVPPGALPVYLQNRGRTYVPYQPRGHQPTPMPQSTINARTAARAAHAPVLAQQRQQTHANIISGRIPAPAGSTRSQTSARAAQQAAQPAAQARIVNAPPNNTRRLWNNLGGRHSHRRKTNKKRSKSRRSFKK